MRRFLALFIVFAVFPAVAATPEDKAEILFLNKRVQFLEDAAKSARTDMDKAAKEEAGTVRDVLDRRIDDFRDYQNKLITGAGVFIAILIALGYRTVIDAKKQARQELEAVKAELRLKADTTLGEHIASLRLEYETHFDDLETKLTARVERFNDTAAAREGEIGEIVARMKNLSPEKAANELSDKDRETIEKMENAVPEAKRTDNDLRALAFAAFAEGDKHDKNGNRREARAAFERALNYYGLLRAKHPRLPTANRDFAVTQCRLGDLFLAEGRRDEARAAFQRHHAIFLDLTAADPNNPDCRRNLAVAESRLGDAFLAEGRRDEARAAFQRHHAIFLDLTAAEPNNPDYRWNLAVAESRLGEIFLAEGRRDEARAAFQRYHAIFLDLTAADPNNPDYRRNLAVAESRLGEELLAEGKGSEARKAFERGHTIVSDLLASDPSNRDLQRSISSVSCLMARAWIAEGNAQEAEGWLDKTERCLASLLEGDPIRPLYRQDRARLTGVRGDWHAARGQSEQAQASWRQTVAQLAELREAKGLNGHGWRYLEEYQGKLAG